MAIPLADITGGNVAGSNSVTVSGNFPDNTLILIHRGSFWLGQAVLLNSLCTVPVLTLADNDIIQASAIERGANCGAPVRVRPPGGVDLSLTGWRRATQVNVLQPNGTYATFAAEQYYNEYGVYPPASYDPALRVSAVREDYDSVKSTVVDPGVGTGTGNAAVRFDVLISQQPGSTVVTVQNISGITGTALVRFLDTESFGNTLTRTITASATLSISVKGDSMADADAGMKIVPVGVLAQPTAASVADIYALSYRIFDNGYLRTVTNATKSCESRLDGFSAANVWQGGIVFGTDYQESDFLSVPPGTYTLRVRVSGDTNSANWRSITVKMS